MHVQVVFFKQVCFVRIHGFHQTDGDGYRFLHDIAQLTGDNRAALALGEHGLDKQDGSAHSGPGQPGYNTRFLLLQHMIMGNRTHIQILFYNLRVCRDLCILILHDLYRRGSADGIDPLFQSPDPGFHRIIINNGLQGLIGQFQASLRKAHALHCLRNQVLPGNLEFFNRRIAGELDHFHSVQQRLRYGVQAVGCAYKQHIRQIIGYIHVMIRKGAVLLRIQDFQQCAGRIPVVGSGQFIHLIQYHDRIGYTAFLDTIHDTSRHSPDISSSVAADICFVTHTAQADPDILPVQRLRDALADTGLAGTRRADKQEDRSGLFFLQIHYCDLLNYTFFHFVQAEMVLIQDPLRF